MGKEDVEHICDGILFSHKKEWDNAICSNMDGPRDDHIKWSKSEKDKYHMISLFLWNQKKKKTRYKWAYLQNRNRLTDIENKLMVTKGEGGREGKIRNLGIHIYMLLYIKLDNQQGPTV